MLMNVGKIHVLLTLDALMKKEAIDVRVLEEQQENHTHWGARNQAVKLNAGPILNALVSYHVKILNAVTLVQHYLVEKMPPASQKITRHGVGVRAASKKILKENAHPNA